MTDFKFEDHYRGNLKWLSKNIIFLTKAGSHAYGMNTPTSDLDVRGIFIPPKEYFLGFSKSIDLVEIKGDPDVVVHALQKFMFLASQTNPNIIELLFSDPSDWMISSLAYLKLYENRELFLSKKARHTFSGYAFSQLSRLKSHKEWLLSPPTHKPAREEFGLTSSHKLVNRDQMGAFEKLSNEGHEFDENLMTLVGKEKAYQSALTHWNQYQSWKENRNPKRAEMEAKFGFDGKHASHLVRLMRMCEEILSDGKVLVKRPDAEELLSIRNGAWTYDQLIEWADNQEKKIELLYKTSDKIPNSVDIEKLDTLCVEIVEEFLK